MAVKDIYARSMVERAVKIFGSGGGTAKRSGNTITAIGDSITAYNGDGVRWNGKGWLNWACVLTDSKFKQMYHSATPGHTTAQVLSDSLPALLARPVKPDYCAVLTGTNDLGTNVPYATTFANLTLIYARLESAGITPILCTVPPRNNPTNISATNIYRFNAWIRKTASEKGYPLIDFYGALVDPATGNYKSGLNSDDIHPTEAGAKTMGEAAAKVLNEILNPWTPAITQSLPDPSNVVSNPLNLTDTDSDGIPDGWQAPTPAGATFSLVNPTNSDVVGKWFKTTRATAGGTTVLRRSFGSGINPGDRYGIGLRFKLEKTTTAQLDINLFQYGGSTLIISPLYQWKNDTDAHTRYLEFVVPAGIVSFQLDVSFSGVGELSLGQFTLRNLTTLGI